MAQHRGAGRLEHHDRLVAVEAPGREALPQDPAGALELTRGVPGEPAAHVVIWDGDVEASRLEDPDRREADARGEVVGERVGPEDEPLARWRR